MSTVTLTAEYQVVIPREIREALALRPGQKLQAIQYGNRIELIPQRSLEEARGFLPGLDTEVEREPEQP